MSYPPSCRVVPTVFMSCAMVPPEASVRGGPWNVPVMVAPPAPASAVSVPPPVVPPDAPLSPLAAPVHAPVAPLAIGDPELVPAPPLEPRIEGESVPGPEHPAMMAVVNDAIGPTRPMKSPPSQVSETGSPLTTDCNMATLAPCLHGAGRRRWAGTRLPLV